MNRDHATAAFVLLACTIPAAAQQITQVQLKIEPTNRTLTVSAEGRVNVDPDLAIIHIGYQTQPSDAKSAYAAGAKTSNDIIGAIKQAGIPETSIHSEWQRLDSVTGKPHKFTLVQQWTVRTPPERAAEILDVAITAGALESGDIDWTIKDEQVLADQALAAAAARARANAEVLAKSMGVRLGAPVYVSNEISTPRFPMMSYADKAVPEGSFGTTPTPLAIEPRKVIRTASVYAVYAIE